MKKSSGKRSLNTWTFLLIFLFPTFLSAQFVSLFKKKVPGFFIQNGDTHRVTFRVPIHNFDFDFAKMQRGIAYWTTDGKKHKLRPGDATEVLMNDDGHRIRFLSRQREYWGGQLGNYSGKRKNVFLRLVREGKMMLYVYYRKGSSGTMYNAITYTNETYIFQKNNSDLVPVPLGLNANKELASYFLDCPQVAEKVKSGRYSGDIENVVDDYNRLCGGKKPWN